MLCVYACGVVRGCCVMVVVVCVCVFSLFFLFFLSIIFSFSLFLSSLSLFLSLSLFFLVAWFVVKTMTVDVFDTLTFVLAR